MINLLFKNLFIGVILFFQVSLNAQSGVWTWMHGSETENFLGDYGIKGVSSATNEPPARWKALHWQDKDGNFWLFGGTGPNENMNLNDLWKFDPYINQWTWVHGTQNSGDLGSFGTKGVSSPTNVPPAIKEGVTWYDENNSLYLYGGTHEQAEWLTNLWKYDISLNEWVWLWGDGHTEIPTNNGDIGVAAQTNSPGKRTHCKSSWFRNDSLWLFGGACTEEGSIASSVCSDIWIFDIQTNLWTLMKEPKGYSSFGVPGILGEHDEANFPGGRYTYSNWVVDSIFYCYSGPGIATMRTDLWEFDMNNMTWAWIDGSMNMNEPIWNEHCEEDSSYNPAYNWLFHTVQTKHNCNDVLWLFGGENLQGPIETQNDLWAYIPNKSVWTLVWGTPETPEPPNYGQKGIPDISNVIPSRWSGTMWTDSLDNIWIFGGSRVNGIHLLSDMWKYEPDYSCFELDSFTCCELMVDIRIGNVNSDSLENGTISINVLDGVGDIEYSIDEGNTWTDDNFFEDLPAGDYNVIVRDQNGCIYEGIVTVLDFNTATFGLENDLSIEVFPNPASDIFYYAIGSRDPSVVQVYSLSGELISCRKADRRIEVSNLPSGTYILRIVSEGKSGMVKFQKI